MNNENEMKFLQQTFQVLFHESLDIIFLLDYDNYRIMECNIEACRILGATLSKIRNVPIQNFIKEKERLRSFFEETREKGRALGQFTLVTLDRKEELKYGFSSAVVEAGKKKYIVLICRYIQYLSEYEERQELIYDLFQHDLLNKLHAQIGYIDFARRILQSQNERFGIQHVLPMLEKVKDIAVRTMYNIQNASILFRLQDNEPVLQNMSINDAVDHAIRYIKNFFGQRITTSVEKQGNFLIPGDEYLYRLFVNIIVRMLSYTIEKVNVELYVEPPGEEEARVVLHFEGLILNNEQKDDFTIKRRALERKNLDIILIQTLLERYHIRFSLADVRRGGHPVATKIVLRMSVVEWDKDKS